MTEEAKARHRSYFIGYSKAKKKYSDELKKAKEIIQKMLYVDGIIKEAKDFLKG